MGHGHLGSVKPLAHGIIVEIPNTSCVSRGQSYLRDIHHKKLLIGKVNYRFIGNNLDGFDLEKIVNNE